MLLMLVVMAVVLVLDGGSGSDRRKSAHVRDKNLEQNKRMTRRTPKTQNPPAQVLLR